MGDEGLLTGVYRGWVQTTSDPEGLHRAKMLVPQALGDLPTDWALPMQPIGLSQLPKRGDPVWVLFEGGDPAYPVWSGSWATLGQPAVIGATTVDDVILSYLQGTHVLF